MAKWARTEDTVKLYSQEAAIDRILWKKNLLPVKGVNAADTDRICEMFFRKSTKTKISYTNIWWSQYTSSPMCNICFHFHFRSHFPFVFNPKNAIIVKSFNIQVRNWNLFLYIFQKLCSCFLASLSIVRKVVFKSLHYTPDTHILWDTLVFSFIVFLPFFNFNIIASLNIAPLIVRLNIN